MLIAAAAVAVAALGGGGEETRATACQRADDPVILQNRQARVMRQSAAEGGWIVACARSRDYLRTIGLPLEPGAPLQRGVFDLRLARTQLAYRAAGYGCGRGQCEGPVAFAADVRPSQRRERVFVGAVGIDVTGDGRVALIERASTTPPAPDDPGIDPGPGPFRVVAVVGRRRTVIDGGAGIDPRSLDVRDARITWMRDGVGHAARFPRPR